MHDTTTPRLSRLVTALPADDGSDPAVIVLGAPSLDARDSSRFAPSNRRTFLARASTLSLALPSFGAALAACAPEDGGARRDSARAGGAASGAGATGQADDSLALHNSNQPARLRGPEGPGPRDVFRHRSEHQCRRRAVPSL